MFSRFSPMMRCCTFSSSRTSFHGHDLA
jgi:hypothetical protein